MKRLFLSFTRFLPCAVLCLIVFGAVPANAAPELRWPSGNPSAVFERVEGNPNYNYIVRIVYANPIYVDESEAAPGVMNLWVDLDDSGTFEANELVTSLFEPENFWWGIDLTGELYTAYVKIISDTTRTCLYNFEWYDKAGNAATGAPTSQNNYVEITTYNYQIQLSCSSYPGYSDTYVIPDTVDNEGLFEFRIRYTDEGNEAPVSAQIYIDMDSDDVFVPSECFSLQEADPQDTHYYDGKEYCFSKTISHTDDGAFKYYFLFRDSLYTVTTNVCSVIINETFIPYLDFVSESGYDGQYGVCPRSGESGDTFTFRVNYCVESTTLPDIHQVWIDVNDNGTYEITEKYDMQVANPSDNVFVDGKEFVVSLTVQHNGEIDGTVPFRFYFTRSGAGTVSGNAAVTQSITVDYVQKPAVILGLNFPNPFGRDPDTKTKFNYFLRDQSDVTITIYDLRGKKVRTISVPAGSADANLERKEHYYTYEWDGRDDNQDFLPNGMYIYLLKAGGETKKGRLVFLR